MNDDMDKSRCHDSWSGIHFAQELPSLVIVISKSLSRHVYSEVIRRCTLSPEMLRLNRTDQEAFLTLVPRKSHLAMTSPRLRFAFSRSLNCYLLLRRVISNSNFGHHDHYVTVDTNPVLLFFVHSWHATVGVGHTPQPIWCSIPHRTASYRGVPLVSTILASPGKSWEVTRYGDLGNRGEWLNGVR